MVQQMIAEGEKGRTPGLTIMEIRARSNLDMGDRSQEIPTFENRKPMWVECSICGDKISGYEELQKQNYFRNLSPLNKFVCSNCVNEKILSNFEIVKVGDKVIFLSVV
jgi:ribosomal protein L34E